MVILATRCSTLVLEMFVFLADVAGVVSVLIPAVVGRFCVAGSFIFYSDCSVVSEDW